MKYLLATIILLLLATSTKSQDTIKIPTPIARQIAKDLTICDSSKAMLDLTSRQLLLTEDKVVLKDSIISSFRQKCLMYDTMMANEKKKFEIQSTWVEDLRKMNKQLKSKLLYTKITLSAGIGFLAYLLLR
jgi:hypothetical protein